MQPSSHRTKAKAEMYSVYVMVMTYYCITFHGFESSHGHVSDHRRYARLQHVFRDWCVSYIIFILR